MQKKSEYIKIKVRSPVHFWWEKNLDLIYYKMYVRIASVVAEDKFVGQLR